MLERPRPGIVSAVSLAAVAAVAAAASDFLGRFLAAFCFYILCLCLRINPWIGIFGSLSFAYATYNPVIISVGHDTKMWSIAYMPALLGSILLIYNRRYWLGAGLTALWHHHAHGLHSPYWWLKCAVGVHNDKHRLTSAYHRLLVWDIMRKPALTRLAEQALNPLIGKSLVVYAVKAPQGVTGGRVAPR